MSKAIGDIFIAINWDGISIILLERFVNVLKTIRKNLCNRFMGNLKHILIHSFIKRTSQLDIYPFPVHEYKFKV